MQVTLMMMIKCMYVHLIKMYAIICMDQPRCITMLITIKVKLLDHISCPACCTSHILGRKGERKTERERERERERGRERSE